MEKNKTAFLITNFVTFIRAIGVAAIVPVFKLFGGFFTFLLSAGCFLTDYIDGQLARGFKCSTFFGSMLDATCDKVFLIVNLLLLMGITPLAVVPILLELGIATVQSLKFHLNVNVQPNKYGKAKMWVAGVCISLSYLLVDKNFLNYVGANMITKIVEFHHIKVFSAVLLPLVISEVITLGTYIKEYFDVKKGDLEEKQEQVRLQEKALEEEINNISLKEFIFENQYYEKYKDCNNLRLVRTLAKKKK